MNKDDGLREILDNTLDHSTRDIHGELESQIRKWAFERAVKNIEETKEEIAGMQSKQPIPEKAYKLILAFMEQLEYMHKEAFNQEIEKEDNNDN